MMNTIQNTEFHNGKRYNHNISIVIAQSMQKIYTNRLVLFNFLMGLPSIRQSQHLVFYFKSVITSVFNLSVSISSAKSIGNLSDLSFILCGEPWKRSALTERQLSAYSHYFTAKCRAVIPSSSWTPNSLPSLTQARIYISESSEWEKHAQWRGVDPRLSLSNIEIPSSLWKKYRDTG